jgi:DNA-binding NarL/FixJ family response regulator
MIRVLIVEDVSLFRTGLRWTIEQTDDGVSIGEATQVDGILHLAQTFRG